MARRSIDPYGLGIEPAQIGGPLLYGPSMPFSDIASIPTGAIVYDTTDGVVKRKVGDYLVDVQYNVIGSGPIADAPVASENDGLYYYDNVTGNLYQSIGREWVGVNAWLMDGGEYITLNGENINVDDPNLQLLGANGFALGSNGFILGV